MQREVQMLRPASSWSTNGQFDNWSSEYTYHNNFARSMYKESNSGIISSWLTYLDTQRVPVLN